MEDFLVHFGGILAISLSLGFPVIIAVLVFVAYSRKNKLQNELRHMIIENNTDPETAKLLIGELPKDPTKAEINFTTLRNACIMLGVGLGALIDKLSGVDTNSVYFWLIIAFGVGVGLLISFIVEMHFSKKNKDKNE